MSELRELQVCQLAEEAADEVWNVCSEWDWFTRCTIGKQLIRAADSIDANIAEGYGRYAFRENIQFCYYARGSLMETRFFLKRAAVRHLMREPDIVRIELILSRLHPMLNADIRSIRAEIVRGSADPSHRG